MKTRGVGNYFTTQQRKEVVFSTTCCKNGMKSRCAYPSFFSVSEKEAIIIFLEEIITGCVQEKIGI